MESNNISKLNILLSGGSSGIGKSIAKMLIERGANVGIISRRNPTLWAHDMPSWDAAKNWINADFNDYHNLETPVNAWINSLDTGQVDILILCAATYGSTKRHNFEQTSLAEWEDVIAVNATAPFILAKRALETMLPNNKGLIIGITSDVAYKSGPERVAYSVSKTAMRTMLDGITDELTGKNIAVIQLFPSVQVKTEGIMNRRPKDFDYKGYAQPSVFNAPIIELLTEKRQKSAAYTIDDKGTLRQFS